MKYKVIGRRAVGGVAPGGTVDLDPAVVNVKMLLQTRHIEELPAKPAPKKAADKAAADEGGE